ncbi:hypothetical protein MHYP_G00004950 [Metynnis hypsauchen]
MAPKKPPAPQSTQHDEQPVEVEEATNRLAEATQSSSASDMEHVCSILQSFIREQRAKDEYLRKEAAKNEQRWRTMQHQFGLLQAEVQRCDAERSQASGEQVEASELSQTQILRSTLTARGVQRRGTETPLLQQQFTSAMWPTPKMPVLKDSDDIEHYLTTFERMAQAAGWPVESWAIHLVPLLDGECGHLPGLPLYWPVKPTAVGRRGEVGAENLWERTEKGLGVVCNKRTSRVQIRIGVQPDLFEENPVSIGQMMVN